MAKSSYAEAVAGFHWNDVLRDLGWHDDEPIDLGHTIVDRHADGGRAALHWVGKDRAAVTMSYRELRALSNRIANLLRALGVRKGDRVAGVLPRVRETIAVMVGVWKAGGIYVPVFTGLGSDAVGFRLRNSGAQLVVTHRDCRGRVPDMENVAIVTIADAKDAGLRPSDVDFRDAIAGQPDQCESQTCARRDPAVILYTSGSTGEPKGVAIAANFLAATRPYMQFGVDLKPGDRFWPTGDPGWGYGFVCYHAALAMGVPVFSYEATPTPRDFLQFLQDERISNVATVPTLLRGVMALGLKELARYDLCLRAISSCGEPLNSEVIRFFQEGLGIIPRDHFGSSENGLPLGNFNALDADVKPGSMGLPMPGFAMAIVDDDGGELAPGEVGYLAQRADGDGCYALGYWQDAERTQLLFRQGWIIGGDLARCDASGYFWFDGRADDVIKSSAYRIGPFEVESAILHHPAIAEAAVIGEPDALKGHIVKAYVTLRPGHQAGATLAAEIQDIVRRMVGDHAYPREVEVVENLPKTESGKIQRFKLRAGH